MIFISLAVLMAVVAAACVAIPLWRNHPSRESAMQNAGEGAYRKQLAELERDLANGTLAENDYQSALRDLEQERQSNQVPTPATLQGNSRHRRVVAATTALTVILAAGLLYWHLGDWRVGTEGITAASRTAVEDMVQGLSDRLHTTDKDDLKGWMMLGHSYIVMNRYQDALAAFGEARKLAGDDNADVLSSYAEALALAGSDNSLTQAGPLFERVLKIDPDNVKALWYGGLVALQQGNRPLAIKRWNLLRQQDLPPQYLAFVDNAIKQAGGKVDDTVKTASPSTVIHVHVALSARLKSKVSPTDTVFVFARPAGVRNGPPLAVHRLQVRDLPLDVDLSDKDAMIAGRNLSQFSSIELVARISQDGSPLPKPGEPMGSVIWKRGNDSKSAKITIDTISR